MADSFLWRDVPSQKRRRQASTPDKPDGPAYSDRPAARKSSGRGRKPEEPRLKGPKSHVFLTEGASPSTLILEKLKESRGPTKLWIESRAAQPFGRTRAAQTAGLYRPPKPCILPLSNSTLTKLHSLWDSYWKKVHPPTAPPRQAAITLAKVEFAGARVRILRSLNPCHILLEGTVLNETANMFVLQRNESNPNRKGRKRWIAEVPKKGLHMEVITPDEYAHNHVVLCSALDGRDPCYRTKCKPKKVDIRE